MAPLARPIAEARKQQPPMTFVYYYIRLMAIMTSLVVRLARRFRLSDRLFHLL